MKFNFFLYFVMLVFFCQAQIIPDTIKEQGIKDINKELERTGLNKVLRFEKVIYEDSTLIRIQFKFIHTGKIQNESLWHQAKKQFLEQKDSLKLLDYLYFFSLNAFQIQTPEKVVVELRQSLTSEKVCPFIQIFYLDSTKEFKSIEKLCMANASESINLEDLKYYKANASKTISLEDLKFYREKSVSVTIKSIREYARLLKKHFKKIYKTYGGFEKKSDSVGFTENLKGNRLYFEITNLKQEVLYDAGEGFLANMIFWLWGKRYIPYEYLKIDIHITPDEEKKEVSFQVKVRGRHGSGFFETNRWHNMKDLDAGFPKYTQEYADKIMKEIINVIRQN